MRLQWHTLAAISLLTFVTSVVALADESPKLPDQYAEVVLRVEGMI